MRASLQLNTSRRTDAATGEDAAMVVFDQDVFHVQGDHRVLEVPGDPVGDCIVSLDAFDRAPLMRNRAQVGPFSSGRTSV